MTEKAPSGRKKVARLGVAAAAVAAAVLLAPWKRCGTHFGIPGLSGSGEGEPDRPPPAGEQPSGSGAAPAPRCQIRLDARGLSVDGKPAQRAAAVAACKKPGAADVVVTGDAAQGDWDALREALLAAGVETYVRGAPDTGAGVDAGA